MIKIIKKDGTIKSGNPVPGADGLSAYEIWLQEGNVGTEQDFLDSLVGPQGPPGSGGSGSFTTYIHTQSLPSTVWTVTHNLGYIPSAVSVIDSSNRLVLSDVEHININSLIITFAAGFSGVAYVN